MRNRLSRLAEQVSGEDATWAANDAGDLLEVGQSRNLVVEVTMQGRKDVCYMNYRSCWRKGEGKFDVVDVRASQAGASEVEAYSDTKLETVY